ncbi:hypothetical protein PLANPX_3408 [Lacipirellula parvula]|uniref:Uncharacterized protein n=1 Tax=Lacipirellula parvula TaxID=2650471 RepID=A0A5K7XHP3_9BACT|nr:hypothetical protein PLANPX_3408 [Lacipirellula parvula]
MSFQRGNIVPALATLRLKLGNFRKMVALVIREQVMASGPGNSGSSTSIY